MLYAWGADVHTVRDHMEGAVLLELAKLGAPSSAALVGAVATDAWTFTIKGFARALGRGYIARISATEKELEQTRVKLEADGPEAEQTRALQQAAWATQLEDPLAKRPQLADELRAPIKRITMASVTPAGDITQHVVWFDQAKQAIQAQDVQNNIFDNPSQPGCTK